jgi:hypothetical protein
MAAKTKPPAKAIVPSPAKKGLAVSPPAPPLTLEERLHRIEGMGTRIGGYIQYMCQIAKMTGTSGEAKERAVTAFYEQMVVVDRQLARIHDELRLE